MIVGRPDAAMAELDQRGSIDRRIIELIQRMVPRPLLAMSSTLPPGDPTLYRLGFVGEQCMWRPTFQGGGVGVCELDVTVDSTTFTVAEGELIHGTNRIVYAGGTVDGSAVPAPDAGATPPVEAEYRWVFIELDLTLGTATAKILNSTPASADDQLKPLDSPADGIYRICLSKWLRTSTSWSFVCYPAWQIEHHGIAGQ